MKTSDRHSSEWIGEQGSDVTEMWAPRFDRLNHHLHVVGMTEADVKEIKQLGALMEPYLDMVLVQFIHKLQSVPDISQFIQQHSSMESLATKMIGHVKETLRGEFDEKYVRKRLSIAQVHYKIGLQPQWYLASFHMLQSGLIDLISNTLVSREHATHYISVLLKVLNMEQQLVLAEYHAQYVEGLKNENDRVKKEIKVDICATSQNLLVISKTAKLAMHQLKRKGELASSAVHQSEHQSSETQLLAHDGFTQMKRLNEEMKRIKSSITEVQQLFRLIKESSWEVIEIINIVKTIADNINLLALRVETESRPHLSKNAKTEQVAKEIRELAEETRESVFRMIQLIRLNHTFIDGMVHTLTTVDRQMGVGMKSSRETKGTFKEIVAGMDENLHFVEEATNTIETLLKNIMEYHVIVENMAVTVEELNDTASRL
ncbi:heme-based aerotactic transducer [Sporosarcina luteola]|nr:heme-based aerotactic transducer [Sporosarcina luteola]